MRILTDMGAVLSTIWKIGLAAPSRAGFLVVIFVLAAVFMEPTESADSDSVLVLDLTGVLVEDSPGSGRYCCLEMDRDDGVAGRVQDLIDAVTRAAADQKSGHDHRSQKPDGLRHIKLLSVGKAVRPSKKRITRIQSLASRRASICWPPTPDQISRGRWLSPATA